MSEVKLLNTDSLEYMKSIKDNSVDLCVTDSPYGISFNASQHMENTDWDKMSSEKFYEFNKKWMSEVFRILKQDGTMWLFCSPVKIPEIFKIVQDVGFTNHLDNWTILARAKGRGSTKKLKSLREDILHLTKSPTNYKWHNTEYLREVVVPYMVNDTETGLKKPRGWALDQSTGQRVRWTGAGNVCFFSMPTYHGIAEPQIHSCQKPILLFTELIMQSSNKGDLVFDPFAGSGSSGIAAGICERNYIGCELEKDMFNKAYNWLETVNNPTSRAYNEISNYISKRISSSEKNFKFGFDKRYILSK